MKKEIDYSDLLRKCEEGNFDAIKEVIDNLHPTNVFNILVESGVSYSDIERYAQTDYLAKEMLYEELIGYYKYYKDIK